MNKAIFLDRDGTVITDREYAFQPENIEILDGAVPALKALQSHGFLLIVITNQSGIARGIFTEEQLHVFHRRMLDMLKEQGVTIDGIYYCPHHPDGVVKAYAKECDCRKPNVKMFLDAARDFDIDLGKSFAVGDKKRDCAISLVSECRSCLITQKTQADVGDKVKAVRTWAECVEYILGGEQ